MIEGVRARLTAVGRWLLRFERREIRAFQRWIETTSNLVHLSVLVAVPLLLGIVTALSNTTDVLPYLLFPPLASGSYTMFANPESRYASPQRFVGGLTAGALSGWLALSVTARFWYGVSPAAYELSAGAVALGLFLTGAITWALDIEEASAFSTALLVHVSGTSQITYVLSVAVSSMIVAGAFTLWHEHVYEERANFLYASTKGDDHVLVPMRGDQQTATAMLGGRLAAAHEAGKVVLLDIVEDDQVAQAKRAILDRSVEERAVPDVSGPADAAGLADDPVDPGDVHAEWEQFLEPLPDHGPGAVEAGDVSQDWVGYDEAQLHELARQRAVAESATDLEAKAERVETVVDVPCEVIVGVGHGALSRTISQAASEANCDLIAVPYETDGGRLAGYIRELFAGDVDVIAHRSYDGRTRWKEVMVPVRRASDVAHSMLDFATRLSGDAGSVSACHCIDDESQRRSAEEMLANLVETFSGAMETRVSGVSIRAFLERNARQYDLIVLGSSQGRSTASRLVKPPTHEELTDVETDVLVVDRNY